MIKLLFILIPSILAGLGVLQTVVYAILKKRFHEFGKVAGKITYSRFLNYTDPDGKREIGAIIKFNYSVRGQDYEGDTPILKGYEMFPSFDYYDELVKRYPPGEVVNVHFLRNNPKIAYLEVAPLSKVSTVLAPVMSISSIAILVAYALGVGDIFWGWFKATDLGLYINYHFFRGQ